MYKKEKKFLLASDVEVSTDQRIIQGYLAKYNPDQGGDRINPGAFSKTFSERGPRETPKGIRSKIKLGFNHGPVIGIPIILREDSQGAYYEGKVDPTPLGDEVLARIDSGSLDSSSFEYSVFKASFPEDEDGVWRVIDEVKVYEVGPVDYPMNEEAQITGRKFREECIVQLCDRMLQLLHKKDMDVKDIPELKALYTELTARISVDEKISLPEVKKQPNGSIILDRLTQFQKNMEKFNGRK